MTTKLTKPLARETFSTLDGRAGRSGRVLIVTLLPGDLLEFREKGRRQRWTLPIGHAAVVAIRAEVAATKRKKAEEKAERKKK